MKTSQKIESNKVVIYCRVSTKEQVDEGNSLHSQEKNCKEYALKHGYEIAGVFIEQGESAKTANRPELQKLLAFCTDKKKGIKAVVIYKLDRMSRNTFDYSQIKIILKQYGVEIISTSEQFENNPTGRFFETTMAGIAQLDNDIRAERCAGGMRDAMRDGRYVWMASVGYDNVRIGGKATIAPNILMAPHILRAFEFVSKNLYPVEDVWRMVTAEGLRKKNGKPVSRSYFHSILRNKLYTGWIEKFGERHKGLFEPIVSEELFDQVQHILNNKGRKIYHYKTDNPDFPLRRFVTHPTLGKKLTGSWSVVRKGKKYPFYRFEIKGSNYKRDEFEEKFKTFMDSFGMEPELVSRLKKFVNDEFYRATGNDRLEANKMRSKIKELNDHQTALIDKNLKGVLTDDVLKQQLDRIDKEIASLHITLASVSDNEIDANEVISFCEDYLTKPSVVWEEAGISSKLKLQRFQFPSNVTFDGEKFGTTETSILFKAKSAFGNADSTLVDPTGLEPATPSLQMMCSTR